MKTNSPPPDSLRTADVFPVVAFLRREATTGNPSAVHRLTSGTHCSEERFKKDLFNYYLYLTKSVYDVGTPQTFKSVCIKCHSSRPLNSLLDRMCCLAFLFLSFLKCCHSLLVVLLIFFFSGTRSGACYVSDPELLTKFINKINE